MNEISISSTASTGNVTSLNVETSRTRISMLPKFRSPFPGQQGHRMTSLTDRLKKLFICGTRSSGPSTTTSNIPKQQPSRNANNARENPAIHIPENTPAVVPDNMVPRTNASISNFSKEATGSTIAVLNQSVTSASSSTPATNIDDQGQALQKIRDAVQKAETTGPEAATPIFQEALDLLSKVKIPKPNSMREVVNGMLAVYGKEWNPEVAPLFLSALKMINQLAVKFDWSGLSTSDPQLRPTVESSNKLARDIYRNGFKVLDEYGLQWVQSAAPPDETTMKLYELTIDMTGSMARLKSYESAEPFCRRSWEIVILGVQSGHEKLRDMTPDGMWGRTTLRLQGCLDYCKGREAEPDAIAQYNGALSRILRNAYTSIEEAQKELDEASKKLRKLGYQIADFRPDVEASQSKGKEKADDSDSIIAIHPVEVEDEQPVPESAEFAHPGAGDLEQQRTPFP